MTEHTDEEIARQAADIVQIADRAFELCGCKSESALMKAICEALRAARAQGEAEGMERAAKKAREYAEKEYVAARVAISAGALEIGKKRRHRAEGAEHAAILVRDSMTLSPSPKDEGM